MISSNKVFLLKGWGGNVIKFYYENEKLESIRTKNGSRSQQVHIKGTLLFYNLYKKYGLDVIKDF